MLPQHPRGEPIPSPEHLAQRTSAHTNICHGAGPHNPSAVALQQDRRADSLDPFNLFFRSGTHDGNFPVKRRRRILLSNKEALSLAHLSGTNLRLRGHTRIAEPRASSKPFADLAAPFAEAVVVMGGSFIALKEELDEHHACSPISWSQAH